MQTSCVEKPAKDPLLIIRQWQVTFSDGNQCAAAMLSIFSYYHDIKLNIEKHNKHSNKISNMHGEDSNQHEHVMQYHTLDELKKLTFDLFSRNRIRAAIDLLIEKNVLTKHRNPNPRYNFDKTSYYVFYPEVCNEWLSHVYIVDYSDSSPRDDRSSRIDTVDGTGGNYRSSCTEPRSSSPGRPSSPPVPPIAKNTAKTSYKEKAAAVKHEDPNPAAAFSENNADDDYLHQALTPNQHCAVKALANNLATTHAQDKSPTAWLEEITAALLCPKSFTGAGRHFPKKLNTIQKCIRQGKWTTPTRMVNQKAEQEQHAVKHYQQLTYELQMKRSVAQSLENSIVQFQGRPNAQASFKKEQQQVMLDIEALQHTINSLPPITRSASC